jgi:GT2 family glycosyltransferase
MPETEVAIIWLNYNSLRFWKIAQRSLMSTSGILCGIRTDVYVVDNASTDGSYERLCELISQGVVKNAKTIRSPINTGYAGGNNLGYERLPDSVRYFALMNNDFLLAPGALRQLIRVMEEHPEIGAIQGEILSMEGSIDNCGFKINEALAVTAVTEPLHEVSYTSGCFSVYRMEAVKKINRHGGLLFEPDFFSYGDDNVLGLELWEVGYKCVCIDTVAGYHVGRASSKSAFLTFLINRAWVALIVASDSRFRALLLYTSFSVVIIGVIRLIVERNPAELPYAIRAWFGGLRLGKKLITKGERISLYSAPIEKTSLVQTLFVSFSNQTQALVSRRYLKSRARKRLWHIPENSPTMAMTNVENLDSSL